MKHMLSTLLFPILHWGSSPGISVEEKHVSKMLKFAWYFSARWHFTSVKWKSEYDLFWKETIFFQYNYRSAVTKNMPDSWRERKRTKTHHIAVLPSWSRAFTFRSRILGFVTLLVFFSFLLSLFSLPLMALITSHLQSWKRVAPEEKHRCKLKLKDLQKENIKKDLLVSVRAEWEDGAVTAWAYLRNLTGWYMVLQYKVPSVHYSNKT